ncbi:MAG: TetR/AcrR family transcriptional regulator [Treponema sp.]|jgi:AcrR family transcriptional regulator|nr:TetR/AcrR family transcriptional regulator [Treponema sp.]
MPIIVEHEKRRKEILEKALDVFVEQGFENTTFQKIADRCAVTRTSLYIYFKNKKDVFNYSIQQLLVNVEADIQRIKKNAARTYAERLIAIFDRLIDAIMENGRLLTALFGYLRTLAKNNADPERYVRRRTIRLRHILSSIIIEGEKRGEFCPLLIKDVNEMLYGLLEAAIFRITILHTGSGEDIKHAAGVLIRHIANYAAAPPRPVAPSRPLSDNTAV